MLRATTEGQPAQVLCAGCVWSLRRANLPQRYAFTLSSRSQSVSPIEMGRRPPSFLVRPIVLQEAHRCMRSSGSWSRQKAALTKAYAMTWLRGSVKGET